MTKTSKAILGMVAGLGVLALLIPFQVFALQIESRESVIVPADKVIENNFYALGKKVEIRGRVEGDLLALAQDVEVTGEVEGDVIALAQDIEIAGDIKGSVRSAGERMDVRGTIGGNLMFAGNSLNINPEAKIKWNALVAMQKGNIKGEIGRDLHGTAATINITGKIDRNAKLKLSRNQNASALTISDKAVINGDLSYEAEEKGKISSKADIKGGVNYSKTQLQQKDFLDWFGDLLISLFAALLVGIVIVSLWRDKLSPKIQDMIKTPLRFAGWGALFLVITPIIALILIFTSVGFPLGLILFGLWGIVLYVGRVLAAIAIGKRVMTQFSSKERSLMTVMVVGVAFSWLIFSLPFIGWIFSLGAICWGSGMLFSIFLLKNNSKK